MKRGKDFKIKIRNRVLHSAFNCNCSLKFDVKTQIENICFATQVKSKEKKQKLSALIDLKKVILVGNLCFTEIFLIIESVEI